MVSFSINWHTTNRLGFSHCHQQRLFYKRSCLFTTHWWHFWYIIFNTTLITHLCHVILERYKLSSPIIHQSPYIFSKPKTFIRICIIIIFFIYFYLHLSGGFKCDTFIHICRALVISIGFAYMLGPQHHNNSSPVVFTKICELYILIQHVYYDTLIQQMVRYVFIYHYYTYGQIADWLS